jgi:DNA-binding MarR family transcriptional regulator
VRKLYNSSARILLNRIGLDCGQRRVLETLGERGGRSQSELAECLHVSPPSISKMIQWMERKGLVDRPPETDDERVLRVHVTRVGRSLGQDPDQVVCQHEEAGFFGLAPEEWVPLRCFFFQIRDDPLHLSEE